MSDIPINQPPGINVETETTEIDAISNIDEKTGTTSGNTNIDKSLEFPAGLPAIEASKFEILKKQEEVRGRLAIYLLIGLGVTLLGIGAYIFCSLDDPMTKRELITLIWTSEVTLVSGALGFYFGRGSN